MSMALLFHITGATIGLLSGFLALLFRKGSGRHGAAGTVFVASMLGMCIGAIDLAIVKYQPTNLLMAVFTSYLVLTGWMIARRRDGKAQLIDWWAAIVPFGYAATFMNWGVHALLTPTKTLHHYPAAIYFFFAPIGFAFAASDLRMIGRGGVFGAQRIARHLLRMGTALLIASFSFYPGQAKVFPKALRATNLLYVPDVLVAGALIFWMVRTLSRRDERTEAAEPTNTLLERAA